MATRDKSVWILLVFILSGLELGGIVWTEDANHSDQVKALVNRNYGVFGADFVKRLIEFPADRLKEIFEYIRTGG